MQWVEVNGSRAATIHRKGKRADSTYTRNFRVFGVVDDAELHNQANARLTAERFIQIGDYQLMVESYEVRHIADDVYEVSVSYIKSGADDDQPLHRTRSFDTSGGTHHITQATDPTTPERRWGANGINDAPDCFGAIAADGDSVKGIDIVIPSLQWTESYDVPSSYVTSTYIKAVAQLTGTVNNAEFRSFKAGEVLFVGCQGTQEWDTEKGDGPWNLSYKFIASPNAGSGQTYPAMTIGTISGIEKRGHDYMWIRYEDTVDTAKKTLVKKPRHVYVNRVYRDSNFALLGIGTA